MNAPPTSRLSSPALGMALIIFGSLTLLFCRDMDRLGLGNNQDPGPQAFPTVLAIFLIVGGLIELVQWFRLRKIHTIKPAQQRANPENPAFLSGNPSFPYPIISLSLFFLLLIAYIASLDWAGFTLSTLILAPLMMIRLGATAKLAALCSLVLVLLVKGLFEWALKVPLPTGELGIPF
jgi:hypothetical protein